MVWSWCVLTGLPWLPRVTHLKGHEFVVGFGGPGVDLHTILQRDHQELDLLVAHCERRMKSKKFLVFRVKILKAILKRKEREREKSSNLKAFECLTNFIVHTSLQVAH